jgi:hypothetical protein
MAEYEFSHQRTFFLLYKAVTKLALKINFEGKTIGGFFRVPDHSGSSDLTRLFSLLTASRFCVSSIIWAPKILKAMYAVNRCWPQLGLRVSRYSEEGQHDFTPPVRRIGGWWE